ncbi:hypothetical protein PsorP6_002330 [Peronosclerospora sorghi]|uniref:Uncharacterized protein n=1 Tax=Peronosclerospora sorghi TaxID=230839 RepID=A0ACC0WVT8_9STRA|nr:hypothetical protein PsorP6_002330 [Peronosclerospora sorghi]
MGIPSWITSPVKISLVKKHIIEHFRPLPRRLVLHNFTSSTANLLYVRIWSSPQAVTIEFSAPETNKIIAFSILIFLLVLNITYPKRHLAAYLITLEMEWGYKATDMVLGIAFGSDQKFYQRVYPPLFWMTAAMFSGIESAKAANLSSSICFHASFRACCIKLTFFSSVLRRWMASLMSFQTFSIGLRSGEFAGHVNSHYFSILPIFAVPFLERWTGAPYSKRIPSAPHPRSHLKLRRKQSRQKQRLFVVQGA